MTQLRLTLRSMADHRDVLFREDPAKGEIVGIGAEAVCSEERIRCPRVGYLTLA